MAHWWVVYLSRGEGRVRNGWERKNIQEGKARHRDSREGRANLAGE